MVRSEAAPAVRARVPLRISFGGGGTDVAPYFLDHGGVALNVTIDRYVYCSLAPTHDETVRVTSLDYNQAASFGVHELPVYDGNLDLVKAVIHRVDPAWRRGLNMLLQAEAPPGSGLGTSSAVVVATIMALSRLLGVYLKPDQVSSLAYTVERDDLNIAGGYQDQYAAGYGGFNWMEFSRDGVVVEPLALKPETLYELEYKLVLWFTGATRLSAGILTEQVGNYEAGHPVTVESLHRMKAMAEAMRRALTHGATDDFGGLLHESWMAKRNLASSITSAAIDELYEAAREAGAIGGKLLGAGGGGFLLLYIPEDRRRAVVDALSRFPGTQGGPVHFDLSGPVVWASRGFRNAVPAFQTAEQGDS
ncbi:MAG: GHMP kinase [Clostridia bacterium]